MNSKNKLTLHVQDGSIKDHMFNAHRTNLTRAILDANTKILGTEIHPGRLKICEALHINKCKPSMNKQTNRFDHTLQLFSQYSDLTPTFPVRKDPKQRSSMNFENRWVLRSALNFASDGEVVREIGREFQRKGPEKAKADLAKECLTRVKKKREEDDRKPGRLGKRPKVQIDDNIGLAAFDPDIFSNTFDLNLSLYYKVDQLEDVNPDINIHNDFSLDCSLMLLMNIVACVLANVMEEVELPGSILCCCIEERFALKWELSLLVFLITLIAIENQHCCCMPYKFLTQQPQLSVMRRGRLQMIMCLARDNIIKSSRIRTVGIDITGCNFNGTLATVVDVIL
ncbi:hypothetical protein HELRODRAFT_182307 [Helobdella robusta]|uniref:Uncharacterized protein n=1 Tax=Helobdella robusta TaxID=6412 RepID=T1FI12_HELRO|nr:hypothetical protein HELRODRAFT_182307 [Helobdella robusta]ESN91057.1 hypothetical protein HELRODRAFT_182307 [Helobdella robusta]